MSKASKVIGIIAGIMILLGILVVIISVGLGARWTGSLYNEKVMDFSQEYSGVNNLNINIDYGKLTIVQGSSFKVDAHNVSERGFDCKVDNGTLVLNDKRGRFLGLFDVNINLGWDDDSIGPQVTVTVPKDFNADNIRLETGAGKIDASALSANSVDLTVGAGDMSIDGISAKKFSIDCGVGHAGIENADVRDANIKSGVGKIDFQGKIAGKSKVDCGVGDIEMNLEGNYSDYYYKVKTGIGHVKIDNNSYSSAGDTSYGNASSPDSFDIDCGVGNISINTK